MLVCVFFTTFPRFIITRSLFIAGTNYALSAICISRCKLNNRKQTKKPLLTLLQVVTLSLLLIYCRFLCSDNGKIYLVHVTHLDGCDKWLELTKSSCSAPRCSIYGSNFVYNYVVVVTLHRAMNFPKRWWIDNLVRVKDTLIPSDFKRIVLRYASL